MAKKENNDTLVTFGEEALTMRKDDPRTQEYKEKMLKQMEENRKISCSSAILKANNCSGNHNTDKILDIEDMVSQKQEYVDESDLMEQDKYLLDPKLYRETQKPLLQASTLPRHCYSSNRWYRHELNKAFLLTNIN